MQKAVERGVLGANEARELSRRDVQNLIFLPGLLHQGRRRPALGARRGHGRGEDQHRAPLGHHRRRVRGGPGHAADHHAADHARHHPGAGDPRRGADLRRAAQLGARVAAHHAGRRAHHRAARGDVAARADAAAGAAGAAVPARAPRATVDRQVRPSSVRGGRRPGAASHGPRRRRAARAAGHRHQVARPRARRRAGHRRRHRARRQADGAGARRGAIVEEAVGAGGQEAA